MAFFGAVARFLIGAVFGLGYYFLLAPLTAAIIDTSNPSLVTGILGGVVLLSAIAAALTSTIRRTFGFGFLWLGLGSLALPLTTMLLAGRVASTLVDQADATSKSATVVGAGLGGAMMTGAASIVGFFLGAIFLILALVLLLNSKRQVILVDRSTGRVAAGDIGELDTSRWSKKDRQALDRQRGRIEPPMR